MQATHSNTALFQAAPATVWAMKPALDLADGANFSGLRRERESPASISSTLLLKVLRAQNATLRDIHAGVLSMDAETAQRVLDGLPANEKHLAQIRAVAQSVLVGEASELEREMHQLARNLVGILDDLTLAADAAPIDEDSADYQAFIGRLVAEAEAEPAIPGRKALFALFDEN